MLRNRKWSLSLFKALHFFTLTYPYLLSPMLWLTRQFAIPWIYPNCFITGFFYLHCVPQSVVPKPQHPSTWELVRNPNSQDNLTLAESETPKLRPSNLCFHKVILKQTNVFEQEMPFPVFSAKIFFWKILKYDFSLGWSLILCSAPTAFSCVFIISHAKFCLCLSYMHMLDLLW